MHVVGFLTFPPGHGFLLGHTDFGGPAGGQPQVFGSRADPSGHSDWIHIFGLGDGLGDGDGDGEGVEVGAGAGVEVGGH